MKNEIFLFTQSLFTGNGKIVQKIRGHDEDIQGLSWSPSKYHDVLLDSRGSSNHLDNRADSQLSWRNKEEMYQPHDVDSLIAISSREKSISIWSTKTGRQVASLRLPGTSGQKNKSNSDKMTFSTCCWWKRNILLSSGIHGELLEWNLERFDKKTSDGIFRSDGNGGEVKIIHKEHARTLYSIDASGENVETSGQDRCIVSFNPCSGLNFNLPTFASWVYALASNNIDPTITALGAGDGQIRIWRMSSTSAMFDVNIIWQKLNSAKVTALSWHPDKENLLAFGTDEGRVGVVDAFSSRTVPSFCDFKHRTTVYNLCWGPIVSNGQENDSDVNITDLLTDKKVLYSVGDGQVMMHNSRQDGKTINIENIICDTNKLSRKPPSRSDIVFQPNEYKYLVLGSDDGSVEIYTTPKLQMICILKSFNKLIQSLAWHPTYVGDSSVQSTYHMFLATSSNEHDIHVWDLSESVCKLEQSANEINFDINGQEKVYKSTHVNVCDPSNDIKKDIPVLTTPKSILSGHHQRVIYLSWCPHEDAKLLSVSYDCTAQVWDVAKNEPVCNFSGHSGRLFSGLWSPLSSNVILTGGEDSTVYCWNIKDQKNKLPIKKAPKKNAPRKNKDCKETNKDVDDIQAILDDKRKEILTNDANDKEVTQTFDLKDSQFTKDRAINIKRRQKKKTFFPLFSQHENLSKNNAFEDCQDLYEFLYADLTEKRDQISHDKISQPQLSLFSSKSGVENLIEMERKSMREQGDYDIEAHLSLWSGDLIDTIKDASKTGRLTDWLVSASSGISYTLWKEMCVSYALQLVKEDEIVKAASYYLMAHQVLEAIEILRKNHFYKPALTIAKSRMPDDSPLFRDIYTSWAQQAGNDGCYELAAKCWIAAGDFLQASTFLAKRTDPSSLRVAGYLARKAGEHERSRILCAQCATLCVQLQDWKCMETLVREASTPSIDQMWEESAPMRNSNHDKNYSHKIVSFRDSENICESIGIPKENNESESNQTSPNELQK